MSSLAAVKLNGNGKRLAPPSPANSSASPTRSAGSPSSATKRQKRENVINSIKERAATPTPAAAAAAANAKDFGSHMMTQLTYAVDFLKSKRAPKTLPEVLDHLTLHHLPDKEKQLFVTLMKKHSRIHYTPPAKKTAMPEWAAGTWSFKAKIPGVHDKTSLLAHLQAKTDASSVVVKDLKDGWPDCDAAISELEAEHKILVVRTRKDNYAKHIWMDQATLNHSIEPEFLSMWHKFEVPSADDIVRKLQAVGQKPASEDPRLKKLDAPKAQNKKRKSTRPPKHQSNSHMAHLLKDYSHMKR